jgi:hypothetical protein
VLPSDIASELNVSRPFVSKAQRIAEERIGDLLKHTASVNRIKLRHMSPEYGFAVGFCTANQMDTFILYSPKIGLQTWFDHEGECGSCGELSECTDTLTQLSQEWKIPMKGKKTPSDMAAHLFDTIMERMKWKKERS